MLVDFDVGVLKGGLFDDSKIFSKLIGYLMIMLVESVSYFFNVNNQLIKVVFFCIFFDNDGMLGVIMFVF